MAIDEADARHLLRRVGFAPSDAEVAHFAGREIPDVVDEVLDNIGELPAQPDFYSDERDWWVNQRVQGWWINRMSDATWLGRPSAAPHPLVEKLALFWHGHFATSYRKVTDAQLMWEQIEFLRDGALGDFEQLCRNISLHGAMLIYLDNESNRVGNVQENFARELMELFTTGIGHYTEHDVVEVARAWTGHGTVGWVRDEMRYDGTYRFRPGQHDEDPKTIFGVTRNWDGPEVITELVRGSRQPATATFLATKLWRFLVSPTPNSTAIGQIAAAFIASDMQIDALVRAMLSHPDFWAPANRNVLVKSPVQFVADFNRCADYRFINNSVSWRMESMGQILLDPPDVSGWGINDYWLSTATMWGRAEYVNGLRGPLTNETGFLADLENLSAARAADLVFDTFRIADPSPGTRSAVEAWHGRTMVNDQWALPRTGITLAALCPEFQVM